jgi:flagellar hook protein FlgE
MSLYGALFSGVSGLRSQSSAMGAISDNITNVNTIGYKGTKVNFQTLITKQVSLTTYSAGGVQSKPRSGIDIQGLLQASNSATDIALSGEGMFIVNEAANPVSGDQFAYTRAGSFKVDAEGYLTNVSGWYLQGWPLQAWDNSTQAVTTQIGNNIYMKSYKDDEGATVYINDNIVSPDQLKPLNLNEVGGTAQATRNIRMGANLPSGDTVGDSHKTNVLIYDSLGNDHNLQYTWTKSAENSWNLEVQPPLGSATLAVRDSAGDIYRSTGRLDFQTEPTIGDSMTIEAGGVTYTVNFTSATDDLLDVADDQAYSIAVGSRTQSQTIAAFADVVDHIMNITNGQANTSLTGTTTGGVTNSALTVTGTVAPALGVAGSFTITNGINTATVTTTAAQTAASIQTAINTALSAANITNVSAGLSGGNAITLTTTSGYAMVTEGAATALTAGLGFTSGAVVGGALQFTTGSTTTTITIPDDSSLNDATPAENLIALINAQESTTGIHASDDGNGALRLSSRSGTATTLTGDSATLATLGLTSGSTIVGATIAERIAGTDSVIFRQTSTANSIIADTTGMTANTFIQNETTFTLEAIDATFALGTGSTAVTFNGDGTPATMFGSSTLATSTLAVDWVNGASDMDDSVTPSMSQFFGNLNVADGMTQLAGSYQINYLTQNGAKFGNFAGVSIGTDGVVTALFDNGVTVPVFMIPVATFINYNGMDSLTGNVFIETDFSGQPTIREGGAAGAGQVNSASLEASTVDLGEEFTNMITTQRAYSAAAKIITTADQMLDELVNIKR